MQAGHIARYIGVFALGVVLGSGGLALTGLAPEGRGQAAGTAVDEFSKLRGVSEPGSSENVLRYTSRAFGFSLEYPKELSVQEYDEGEGSATILFQVPEEQKGFQLFVTPYAGTEITGERIQKDIQSGVVLNPQEVVLGKDGIRGLIFESEAPIIGKSREVWFIHDGKLYEFTTYAALDTWLASIVSTLDFK